MMDAEPRDSEPLGFAFRRTPWMFRCLGEADREPVWGPGRFVPYGDIPLEPAAAILSYGCGVFEGLKAERGEDDRIRLFRVDANAARFRRSAERIGLPAFPEERFLAAVEGLVARSADLVPPAGAGTFYVRPLMHGTEPLLGHAAPRRFAATVYGCPVGDYFRSRDGVRLLAVDAARAAPGGTGSAKAIGNYAGALAWRRRAAERGLDDVLFLDAAGTGRISETAGSNFFGILEGGEIVTPPLDDTILAGITRDSAIRVARELLGLEVLERPLSIDEMLSRGVGAFCTGTAWTVVPVLALEATACRRDFEPSEVAGRIRQAIRGIQSGARPDPFGWTREVPSIRSKHDTEATHRTDTGGDAAEEAM
jgi:branched-chain amino acid aminotransferase